MYNISQPQYIKLPFGSKLKANMARALRRTTLSEEQKARVRKRVVFMLIAGTVPREFREYAKLLRHVGIAELWPEVHACAPRDNRYAMRFYDILCKTDPTHWGEAERQGVFQLEIDHLHEFSGTSWVLIDGTAAAMSTGLADAITWANWSASSLYELWCFCTLRWALA